MTNASLMRGIPSSRLASRFFENDPALSDWFNGFFREGAGASGGSWAPAVDIHETEAAYEVTAELPGLKKDDIQVTLENNVLSISGERRMESEEEKGTARRVERVYGTFSRAFSLPRRVDADAIKATFQDGLLTLTVPKAAEARSRSIEIG